LSKTLPRKVFIFLDTEKHATPFDILTTLDVVPECSFLKYEGVVAEDVEGIVYDAMFPRGEEGAKHTKIFINGKDLARVEEILKKAENCMFPPFELAIMVDPRGAYTTAAAAVAKTLQIIVESGLGSLKNKSVTILAGTGPVGQTAAMLYALDEAKVTIISRSLLKAESIAARINQEIGGEVVGGGEAQTSEQVGKLIEGADVILSTGAAKIQLLSLDVLRKYGTKCSVVADVNAIPPLGIEGLEPDAEQKITDRTVGVGGLVIGRIKNKVEAELIRQVAREPKGVFDYRMAYEIAKIITQKRKKEQPAEPMKYWLP
jgi:threonine dehydrogenase-like Zn-dependent dehydrogenase